MFRSESQVAVDDLQRACRRSAALYREDARILGEATSLAALFGELAEQRERVAERLAEQQRAMDDLPSGFDADREALVEIKDKLQAQLSADERKTLIENRLDTERELEGLADHALAVELPESVQQVLEDLRRQVELGQRRLRAALGALP